ncbi:NBR1-Ig-like domain-containing protein [Variovorax paradoxus]|uniref:Helix-turn-helix domain protein n=1 Tax=Variovorax paradoxus (strain EPS) TaxID=595537 RepID=E6UZ42_VARPE|nr:NBR1-Ig-like domain-containing protein [Variovorax paradoxus]ADU34371.1 helix-turn-helix domain protein [Variovorax paradoxus EPS]
MELNTETRLHGLLIRRARELGKTLKMMAIEAGLARSGLYKLADGTIRDPSVHTLLRLAAAMEVSPIALIRLYGDINAPAGVRDRGGSSLGRAQGLNDSRDAAMLNADVTIPHHAVVNGGEVFEKVWEVQNVGEVFWMGRRLVRVDRSCSRIDADLSAESRLHLASAAREIVIPNTPPGGVVRLSARFSAPRENCSIASVWRIEDQALRPCYGTGFFLGVIVTVIDR